MTDFDKQHLTSPLLLHLSLTLCKRLYCPHRTIYYYYHDFSWCSPEEYGLGLYLVLHEFTQGSRYLDICTV